MELEVPTEQRHLPRHERQFPYRPIDARERREVDAEVAEILTGVEGMIREAVDSCLPRYLHSEFDDVCQAIRIHLWSHSLTRFDAWHRPRVKLTTFLYRCIWMSARDQAKRLGPRVRSLNMEPIDDRDFIGPDLDGSIRAEALAEKILSDPAALDGCKNIRHAQALMTNTADDTTTAAQIGVSPRGLFTARYRLRKLIKHIAANEL